MFKRFLGWFWGWYDTLHIKFFEPELYKRLSGPLPEEDSDE